MDRRTGEIAAAKQAMLERMTPAEQELFMRPINPDNLTPRARRQLGQSGRTQVSRNSPCPCGSRKRFKRCCYRPAE